MENTNQNSSSKLDLLHQLEELKQYSSRDALSGLLNRAATEHFIKQQLEKMAPGDMCALFIIDLDNFKQVNDTLGHQAGDQAIRKSAQILSGIFQAKDIVGRFGGDEFVIFLCGQITEDLARKKGAEICESLQLVLGDHPSVTLTASVGIYLSGKGQQFEGIYQSADLALYKAKKAGKNGFWLKSRNPKHDTSNGSFHPVNTIPLGMLLEHMDSGVALLEMGDSLQLIYISPSFCRIIKADPQSYSLPCALSSLIHPDDLISLEQALRDGLQQGKTVEHSHRVASGDGRWLWWHIRAVKIDYDTPHPVMLVTTTDISQFKESEHKLEETNQRLQAAFDQTSQRLWEVNIPARIFRFYGQSGEVCMSKQDGENFPDNLISNGYIHPNSVPKFRKFAQELLNGQDQGYGNFIIREQNTSCYQWMSLSYRMLFDDIGHAVRAVGLIENLPKSLSDQEHTDLAHQLLPVGLLSNLTAQMRADLTLDTVEELWIEGKDLSTQVQKTPCSKILAQEREKIIFQDKQNYFLSYFDRNTLIRLFREGQRWLTAEYRRTDNSGYIRWVRYVSHMTETPLTGDVCLYTYLIRLDLLQQCEQTIGKQLDRDPVTGLYSWEITELIADTFFLKPEYSTRAVVLIRTEGLKNHQNSIPTNQLFHDITAALSVALGDSCILGQYSTEQILLLFPCVSSEENLRRQIERALAFARKALPTTAVQKDLHFVVGVTTQSGETADFHNMLTKAVHVCDQWWNVTGDIVAFFQEDVDWSWLQMTDDFSSDHVISVRTAKSESSLTEEEKDILFHCISAMLTADSLETSIQSVLANIGNFYRADRTYILLLAEDFHVVTMPYEWTRHGKCSIQQTVSGMKLDRFPLLKRCIAERTSVLLTRTISTTLPHDHNPIDKAWHYTINPLYRQEQLIGFLCVENAQAHSTNTALFSVLIPYLLRERKRFHGKNDTAKSIQHLIDLPELRSYMKSISTLNSDRYSSLGAVCLDIPNIGAINGSKGFEYGSNLLWYVSKTLTDIFGISLLFRTWESEFIAFCPNTTRQVFQGHCSRLFSILYRRYPKEIRMGYSWAEGSFTGNYLAKEARNMMHTDPAQQLCNSERPALWHETIPATQDTAQAGQFTVYFQPKIDMRTGKLFGAEALARGIGENNVIILPDQFIETLEKQGEIRELDFFVLDQALFQVMQWKESGLGTVPVSVNLSWQTLQHPSALASILAIQSRYPQLPPDALELEITENIGSTEKAKLREIVNHFHACGLRLSLDNFRSRCATLPMFTNIKFSTVKLDRNLIADMADNPINQTLIQDIIQICYACGMTCIAEGVETQDQAATLLKAGCFYGQGYYYDHPMPAKQFKEKYLQDRYPTEPKK